MSEPSPAMVVDGIEVSFAPLTGGGFQVLADGRDIGRLELVQESTELVAFRPGGEPLQAWSRLGGFVTMRFSSREVAARALLSTTAR
jgi:hypothetical protein